jgi:signal peptidase I
MNLKSEALNTKPGFKLTKKWVWENILSLVFALLIVFMIRSSIVEAFKIPSGSMIPTLHIGDHIFVNKFQYGLKVPFSDLILDHPVYLINRDHPKHGDIIVFKFPNDDLHYIKRVVGEPGDTIEMRDKILYVNQKKMNQNPMSTSETQTILQGLNDPQYPESSMKLYTEHLDTIDHTVMLDDRVYGSENFGPVTVPGGSLFAMGDNRDWSGDSRIRGFVPIQNVKGKAMVIWLSLWMDFSKRNFNFSPTRIGTLVK